MRFLKCMFLVVTACKLFSEVTCKQTCTKVDSCTCDWGNGTVTTLKDLAKSDGSPKYKDVSDQFDKGLVYSFNPCNPFSEGDCKDVAVCAIEKSNSQYGNYGTQDSAAFDLEEFGDGRADTLTITYTYSNPSRVAKLYIECLGSEADEPFQVLGILPVKPPTLMMAIGSPKACPQKSAPSTKSPPGPGKTGHLSVGSIILIIVASVSVVYVIGGIIVMKFVLKREGKEVFPNYTFWTSGPGYVVDGVKFIGNKVRGKNSEDV